MKTFKEKRINIRHVKLTSDSEKSLKGLKTWDKTSIVLAIETGNWFLSAETYEYADLKSMFEREMKRFYRLPKTAKIEVKSFESDILSFEKGVYPKY